MDSSTLIDELPGASEALRALAARGTPRTYGKARLLIEEGELGDTLFIILAGRLRAFAGADNGREITYGSYGPGEFVGEMSLDGGPRAASVEAVERSVCAVVTRRTLEAFITERPDFAFELIAKLIRRARAATLSARQMALNDVYGRLRICLESQAAEPDAAGVRAIRPRPTHLGIARQIGCSREMVSRLMKDLERGAHVAVASDTLHLLRSLPARW
jgi:CRP/FNR family cyclic AMP-dependent transcriptional regulator